MVHVVFLVMFLPLLSPGIISPVLNVSAAGECEGDVFSEPNWNRTVDRHAKIPSVYDDIYLEDYQEKRSHDDEDDEPMNSEPGSSYQDYVGPEEDWMTWSKTEYLSPLRDDFQTAMSIGEDSVGTLRVNLDPARRTTICVSVQGLNQTVDTDVDVYLMTTTQYDRYTAAYDVSHGYWSWDNDRRDDDQLNEIPPEWRSFSVAGWTTYRDSHQYENIEEVSFSVSLDSEEVSEGLFSGSQKQYFHIVVDNTNNSHRYDAVPDGWVEAYVTVVSVERTTILPPWTVSIVCMGLMMATLAIPFVMNKRYMKSGLDLVAPNQQIQSGMVPSLEQGDRNT